MPEGHQDQVCHTIVLSVALLMYVECWRTQSACVMEWLSLLLSLTVERSPDNGWLAIPWAA
jgi:hypothetical protein